MIIASYLDLGLGKSVNKIGRWLKAMVLISDVGAIFLVIIVMLKHSRVVKEI
jgi:hypothetical protein